MASHDAGVSKMLVLVQNFILACSWQTWVANISLEPRRDLLNSFRAHDFHLKWFGQSVSTTSRLTSSNSREECHASNQLQSSSICLLFIAVQADGISSRLRSRRDCFGTTFQWIDSSIGGCHKTFRAKVFTVIFRPDGRFAPIKMPGSCWN